MTTWVLIAIGVALLAKGAHRTRERAVVDKLYGAFWAWLGMTFLFAGSYAWLDGKPSAFLDERAIDDSDRVAAVTARVRGVEQASVLAALDAMAAARVVDAIGQVPTWPWFDTERCQSADYQPELKQVTLDSGWRVVVTCVLVSGPKINSTGTVISPGFSKPQLRLISPWGPSMDRFSASLHASVLEALYLPSTDAARQHLAGFIGSRGRDLDAELAELEANVAGGELERTWLDYLQYSAAISTTIGNTYLVPSTAAARAITILQSFVSVFLFGYAFQALLLREPK